MTNVDKIEEYMQSGCQKKKRIGFELEHVVCGENYEIVSYETMAECLTAIHEKSGGELYTEEGRIYGLILPEYSLSLEPGCQLEISIFPQNKIESILTIYQDFRSIGDEIFARRGIRLLTKGVHPLVENGLLLPEQLPLLPRKRYQYMDAYFEKTGRFGKHMMRVTASTQVSIDYESMEDAMVKMRVLARLAPVFALLTENRNGLGNGEDFLPHLMRSQIWREVDAVRCGYFPGSVSEEYSFEAYASYVYHTPCILLQKDGETISLGKMSAAEYYRETGREIPMDTQEHLLSMFFPTVRLRTYIEYRVADSMPIERAAGFAVMVAKLMYEPAFLQKLDELTKDVTEVDKIYEAENAIMISGYGAEIYDRPVCEWMQLLFTMTISVCEEKERKLVEKLLPLPLLYEQYCELVLHKEKEHMKCALAMKDYILHSTAKYHERAVRTLYLPKIFTERETSVFAELIETLFGIFHKVIAEYERNADYRALFGFSQELEALILRPRTYACDIPIARVDIFYNEETADFKFCEFNTDGTSAMNEDRELNHALAYSDAHRAFGEKYKLGSYELFDTWVDEVLCIYADYQSRRGGQMPGSLPNVAIVDFLEKGTVNEFEIFRQRFEKREMHAQICDIRELTWDGTRCYTKDGMPIDVIYRRAVTSDIMQHYKEIPDFLAAVKADAVCLLGDFRTQIVHNKLLFKILHMEQTMELLNQKEQVFVRAHVPYTVSLTSSLFQENPKLAARVREDKDAWIIKPEDSYGSKGVHAGVEVSREEWNAYIDECLDTGYILQEFVEPYRNKNIDLLTEKTEWITTSNLTGLFVYNGTWKGVYSRISFDKMISTQYNEMSLATVIVEDRQ